MNPIDNFLSQTQDELYEWIRIGMNVSLAGGYDKETAKTMMEQEILWWIDENKQPVEVEDEIFAFVDAL